MASSLAKRPSPLRPAPSREPQQGRSRASHDRMLLAAERLLRERGNDEFTLQEVSKLGKVSIGSIYCRFDSKDDLMRAVQARVLKTVDAAQTETVAQALAKASDLPSLVALLFDGLAELLREHADSLRPIMLRAASDPAVAAAGKKSYMVVANQVSQAMLHYRSEIGHPDPERAVASAFSIFYAAIARYLGLGAAEGAGHEGDWTFLKGDLALMCASFLTARSS